MSMGICDTYIPVIYLKNNWKIQFSKEMADNITANKMLWQLLKLQNWQQYNWVVIQVIDKYHKYVVAFINLQELKYWKETLTWGIV